jgi:hypothetical protein
MHSQAQRKVAKRNLSRMYAQMPTHSKDLYVQSLREKRTLGEVEREEGEAQGKILR